MFFMSGAGHGGLAKCLSVTAGMGIEAHANVKLILTRISLSVDNTSL